MFLFVDVAFKHEFDDGFGPSDVGESLFGMSRYLIVSRHGFS